MMWPSGGSNLRKWVPLRSTVTRVDNNTGGTTGSVQGHDFSIENREVASYLYANIVISGGTTTIPGFTERMQKELTALTRRK